MGLDWRQKWLPILLKKIWWRLKSINYHGCSLNEGQKGCFHLNEWNLDVGSKLFLDPTTNHSFIFHPLFVDFLFQISIWHHVYDVVQFEVFIKKWFIQFSSNCIFMFSNFRRACYTYHVRYIQACLLWVHAAWAGTISFWISIEITFVPVNVPVSLFLV